MSIRQIGRLGALLSAFALALPVMAQKEQKTAEKTDDKYVLFIVAGIRQSKPQWIKLDRELRKLDGIKRVDVFPVEDEEFCEARAVYAGATPKLATLIEAARKAGFDAMTLETAKERFAGDPAKRIFLDVKEGIKEKEDAINLEVPIKQVDGVKRVLVIFGQEEQEFGSAIVVVRYDDNKPTLAALIEAAKKAGFEATERKTGLPAGTGKKK